MNKQVSRTKARLLILGGALGLVICIPIYIMCEQLHLNPWVLLGLFLPSFLFVFGIGIYLTVMLNKVSTSKTN